MKKQIGVVLAMVIVACGLYVTLAAASSTPKVVTERSSSSVVTKNVTVTMTDFKFKRSFVGPYKRGVKYVFKTVNKGNALHNFDLQKVKAGKVIASGKTYTFSVIFKKAGIVQFICDVPRHAELGMAGKLTVK
jgi:uncharacterized cupredoxin-like copper-binding protein